MNLDDLDPAFLAWSMSTRMNVEAMPPDRTVIEFEFTGAPADCRRFWILSDQGKIDMCLKPPGFDPDVFVRADIRRFVESWRGFRDLRREIRDGHVRLSGPAALVKAFPDWLLLSGLAPYRRQAGGAERKLYSDS